MYSGLERRLACSRSAFKVRAVESVLCLLLMSATDPVEEPEAGISSDRPGLESPELEPRKPDFCSGEELRRSNMTPEREDKPMASLHPAKMCCKKKDIKTREEFIHGASYRTLNINHVLFGVTTT